MDKKIITDSENLLRLFRPNSNADDLQKLHVMLTDPTLDITYMDTVSI